MSPGVQGPCLVPHSSSCVGCVTLLSQFLCPPIPICLSSLPCLFFILSLVSLIFVALLSRLFSCIASCFCSSSFDFISLLIYFYPSSPSTYLFLCFVSIFICCLVFPLFYSFLLFLVDGNMFFFLISSSFLILCPLSLSYFFPNGDLPLFVLINIDFSCWPEK